MDAVFVVAGAVLAVCWLGALVVGVAYPGPDLGPAGIEPPQGRVGVVVPMRNEAVNAAGCVRMLRASDHPDLRFVVVDDDSDDGTAEIAEAALAGDPRGQVVRNQPLPDGWVGKPWACAAGAHALESELGDADWLVFCDADVVLHSQALSAAVQDAERHGAVALSWIGLQQLGTVGEKVVNPMVFMGIAALLPPFVARRPNSRITAVNGQFLAFRHDAYQELGGHAAVSDAVVEDLALGRMAKRRFGSAYRFVWARELMATRMYRGLQDLFNGWSKNAALGARMVGVGWPVLLALALVGAAGPWIGLAAGLWSGAAAIWPGVAAAAQVAALAVFGLRFSKLNPLWALAAPGASVILLAIVVVSGWRTRRGQVSWKGRSYAAGR